MILATVLKKYRIMVARWPTREEASMSKPPYVLYGFEDALRDGAASITADGQRMEYVEVILVNHPLSPFVTVGDSPLLREPK